MKLICDTWVSRDEPGKVCLLQNEPGLFVITSEQARRIGLLLQMAADEADRIAAEAELPPGAQKCGQLRADGSLAPADSAKARYRCPNCSSVETRPKGIRYCIICNIQMEELE
jgi:hypothetical protein